MALFTASPQIDAGEAREIAREAHKEAAKAFRIAADEAGHAQGQYRHIRSVYSGASREASERARLAYMASLERLIALPAVTKSHLAEKKRLIGAVWLSAQGDERFERYRASIAADLARLALDLPYRDRRMAGGKP